MFNQIIDIPKILRDEAKDGRSSILQINRRRKSESVLCSLIFIRYYMFAPNRNLD